MAASLPDDVENRLFDRLGALFPDAETGRVYQFSQTPPAWVQILADLVTWSTVFKAAATAYLARMAVHIADDHWERRHEIRARVIDECGGALQSIHQFFAALHETQCEIGRSLGVQVGIRGPGHHKTLLSIAADDETEFLEQFALYQEALCGIQTAISRFEQDQIEVATDVYCRVSKGRFTLQWQDADSRNLCERQFDWQGNLLVNVDS